MKIPTESHGHAKEQAISFNFIISSGHKTVYKNPFSVFYDSDRNSKDGL